METRMRRTRMQGVRPVGLKPLEKLQCRVSGDVVFLFTDRTLLQGYPVAYAMGN